MWQHASLKQRLLGLILTAITLVWIGAVAATYHKAHKDFNEVLDAQLTQSAAMLVAQTVHEMNEAEFEHTPLLHKYALRISFQIWEKKHPLRLRLHSTNAPHTPLTGVEHGFSNTTIDGHHWRVFSTMDESGKFLIQVAENTEVRDKMARGIADNLLQPLWFSLPLLALLLWIVVIACLRPLDNLTREVAQRDAGNLAALDAASAPRELASLIKRLNQLFVSIDASIQKEQRFTADAAHELRTPVAAIKAHAQVAQASTNMKEQTHSINNVIQGCDRAAHLINQLLTLARLDALDDSAAEVCQLRVIASEVIAAIASAAHEKNIRIELIGTEDALVLGNAGFLRILLRNLIDNAIKHTPAGTEVQVNVTYAQNAACITVSDDGPGIPDQERKKLIERFYRALGTQASGCGLGLSIVKRIAEIHLAELRIVSADGVKGLRIEVTFKPL